MRGPGFPISEQQAPPHLCAEAEAARGVFIIIPGLGIPGRFYCKFALGLAERGYHVLIQELRGQGDSPVRPGRRVDFGYEDLLDDLHGLVQHARSRYDGLAVNLLGHSLGGQLGLMHAVRYPGGVRRLLLVATGSPYYGHYEGKIRLSIRVAPFLFRLLGQLFGYVPGRLVGFGGSEARSVMADWAVLATTDRIAPVKAEFDYEQAFRDLDLPIDQYGFDHDQLAPDRSARGLMARCPEADARYTLLSSERLGFRAGHFNWVHHAETLLPIFLQRFT